MTTMFSEDSEEREDHWDTVGNYWNILMGKTCRARVIPIGAAQEYEIELLSKIKELNDHSFESEAGDLRWGFEKSFDGKFVKLTKLPKEELEKYEDVDSDENECSEESQHVIEVDRITSKKKSD